VAVRVFARAPRLMVGPLARFAVYMQVRTRTLDDALLDFIQGGGRQVVLLGAGFDCRAARFADRLGSATVYEVDHPATQSKKRAVIAGARDRGAKSAKRGAEEVPSRGEASANVHYLPWNFERRPMAELPEALAGVGHDRRRATLTIWEGVTMYLTEPAIEASVGAVRAYSANGSRLAFQYFDRALIARMRLVRGAVALMGEPYKFGWEPGELPAWLASRGFHLVSDDDMTDLAQRLLPPRWAAAVKRGRHIALADC
jgi:methyltransferase (TIGR00027 family)